MTFLYSAVIFDLKCIKGDKDYLNELLNNDVYVIT